MAAAKTDYYELLGVARDADAETIRSAFHAAAREVHPDVSDSPASEQHFRRLAEAYSVLSKPASRLLYDRYGFRGRGNRGFDEAPWDAERAPLGESIYLPIELRAFEAKDGATRLVRYDAARTCGACLGRGTTAVLDPDCPTCAGTGRLSQASDGDDERFPRVEPCPACGGDLCPECAGTGRDVGERLLKVRIPAGLDDGAQLRVRGEGNVGDLEAAPGDLLLDVTVLEPPRDTRIVRYVALVLFLAAVGLLVGYLLLS